MNTARTILATLIVAVIGAVAPAQTEPELIGLTATSPLIVRQSMASCTTLSCAAAISPATAGPVGGTAYDATKAGVWVSNGPTFGQFDPLTCAVLCPLTAAPPGSTITGLAVHERDRVLLMTTTTKTLFEMSLTCPLPSPMTGCDLAPLVPARHFIGGLAVDDVDDLVFFSSSVFAPTMPPANLLHVMTRPPECRLLCSIPVPTCAGTALGPITGVAYDTCAGEVWLTDGFKTLGLSIDVARCSVSEVKCCPPGMTEPYVGLCIRPSHAEIVGVSCTSMATCVSCPIMIHGAFGDAAVGNSTFKLTLDHAPTSAPTVMLLNAGKCALPGLALPAFCGPLLVPFGPSALVVLGPFGSAGPPCTSSIVVPMPVPPVRALCGAVLCSQFAGFCGGGGGTFVSNGLSWMVSGS